MKVVTAINLVIPVTMMMELIMKKNNHQIQTIKIQTMMMTAMKKTWMLMKILDQINHLEETKLPPPQWVALVDPAPPDQHSKLLLTKYMEPRNTPSLHLYWSFWWGKSKYIPPTLGRTCSEWRQTNVPKLLLPKMPSVNQRKGKTNIASWHWCFTSQNSTNGPKFSFETWWRLGHH